MVKVNLAIIGGRDFNDYNYARSCINYIVSKYDFEITNIISGGASGADKLGEIYADEYKINKKIFIAKWDDISRSDSIIRTNSFGKKYDANAGFRRNTDIIVNSDVVIAFWDYNSKETKDSIEKSKKMNKFLIIFKY